MTDIMNKPEKLPFNTLLSCLRQNGIIKLGKFIFLILRANFKPEEVDL